MVCATAAVVWLLAVATAEANLIEKDPPSLQYDHGADKAANTDETVFSTINKDYCLNELKVQGKTGDLSSAGSSSPHKIQLNLTDGTNIQGILCTSSRNTPYLCTLSFKTGLKAGEKCIKFENISEVSLIANGNDGWYIESISTYVKTAQSQYWLLTKDDDFNKWLDGDESYPYNAKKHMLTFAYTCLTELKVKGRTGDLAFAGSSSPHIIQLNLTDGTSLQGELCSSTRNEPYLCVLSIAQLQMRYCNNNCSCLQVEDIDKVSLIENGDDGWYIASISTYVKTAYSQYILLTSDDDFNKWLDGDDEESYPYNAKEHVLTFTAFCLSEIQVRGKTGDLGFAGSSSPHKIQLNLTDGTNLQGTLCPSVRNTPYLCTLSLKVGFKAGDKCVQMHDIHEVSLIANGNDGWYIASISTYVKTNDSQYMLFTENKNLNRWLDGDESYPYNAKKHVLSFAIEGIESLLLAIPSLSDEIKLLLKDGTMLQGTPYHSIRNGPYVCIAHGSKKAHKCVKKSDIQEAMLVATGNDENNDA